jgi:hypothetical protein
MSLDFNSLPNQWNLDTKYLSINHKQYFTRKKFSRLSDTEYSVTSILKT